MKKAIITETEKIEPFGELPRNLPILNKTLYEHQQEALAFLQIEEELHISALCELQCEEREIVVYRDNLFFDERLVKGFVDSARSFGCPSQIAFSLDDSYITEHTLHLQTGIRREKDLYVADLFYFPKGFGAEIIPLVVNTEPREIWYLSIPTKDHWLRHGVLTSFDMPEEIKFAPIRLFVPLRSFMCIESWVHLLFANLLCGIYSDVCNLDYLMRKSPLLRLGILICAILERKRPLCCSKLVEIGSNCQIDSSAVILGPTKIGNDTIIGPGSIIAASWIGNRVFIGQGCHIRNSVVGNNCTLPFRTSVFMSCVMDSVILNSTVRFSIIGRNSFIGDGVWFTDRNLRGREVVDRRLGGEMISTVHKGRLERTGYFLLGSAIGHDVRIATGHIIYPGRTIKSGASLILDNSKTTVVRNQLD